MLKVRMASKRPPSRLKLFCVVSFMALLSLLFTSVDLYTGVTMERGRPISRVTDPVAFNFEVGALMVLAAGCIIYWYILVLRLLRDRRGGHISPEQEK